MSKSELKPFVKWVGGKTQLINVILSLLPKNFNSYIEPFLGGGALFLKLQPENAIVNDINSELVNSWKQIKINLDTLIKQLEIYKSLHSKEFFYKLRSEIPENSIKKAARFIYLNKTCFNGLYRVNSKGEFNVPFNNAEIISSTIFDFKNLNNISSFLNENSIEIYNKNYLEILSLAKENDFVFIDPPYDSENDNSFTNYDRNGWKKQDTLELINTLKKLNAKKVKWMFTNHSTSLILNNLKEFSIFQIPVNRFINSNSQDRILATNEVIIINYKVDDGALINYEFEVFFKSLRNTSYILKDYVSWNKINKISLSLKDLEIFEKLKSDNIFDFNIKLRSVFKENVSIFQYLPLFLAKKVQKNSSFFYIDDAFNEKKFQWDNFNSLYEFLNLTGLVNQIFINPEIKSISNYLFGIEVGLSSNDKKNKSGKFMEFQVENLLKKYQITYKKQEKITELKKLFDFVFMLNQKVFVVETNFFNSSGSKFNSEIERFKALAEKAKKFNFEFIWITDGTGLRLEKEKLRSFFHNHFLFNLFTFELFLKSEIAKQNKL
ncbi:DpnII family type II restriction endonuclease [Mesomycoplasma hyopneumoniae]|uniref:DpnII family type II restriction endonuclease n=1 Tax=Mesomycoplasma hyopneumoniae TaxID=2099 RepID=UPI0032AF21AE